MKLSYFLVLAAVTLAFGQADASQAKDHYVGKRGEMVKMEAVPRAKMESAYHNKAATKADHAHQAGPFPDLARIRAIVEAAQVRERERRRPGQMEAENFFPNVESIRQAIARAKLRRGGAKMETEEHDQLYLLPPDVLSKIAAAPERQVKRRGGSHMETAPQAQRNGEGDRLQQERERERLRLQEERSRLQEERERERERLRQQEERSRQQEERGLAPQGDAKMEGHEPPPTGKRKGHAHHA